jgi:hypothetical protein
MRTKVMMIRVDENITIEVSFNLANREEGYEDDIRFAIKETGVKDSRIFAADETSFLLTPEQAEQLAMALTKAVQESRSVTQ